MVSRLKKYGIFLLAAMMCMCSAACNSAETNDRYKSRSHIAPASDFRSLGFAQGMDVAFQQDDLSLLVDSNTAEVAVYNDVTDTLWRLSPDGKDTAKILSDDLREQVQSLFSLLFYTDRGKEMKYYSYSDSVKDQQFSLYSIPSGIRLEFTVGAADKESLLPKVLTQETMEQLLSVMSEDDRSRVEQFYTFLSYSKITGSMRKKYGELYPNFSQFNLFAVKNNIVPRFKDQIIKAFQKAGFTLDGIHEEYEKIGYNEEIKEIPTFQIPLEFTLEEGTLVTRLPCSEIEYKKDRYKLTEITLTPYFCAGTAEKNGYLLVPDGCGILVDLNNESGTPITTMVYGKDQTMVDEDEEPKFSNKCVVPAYGIQMDGSAFVTVIEEGAALARLETSSADDGTGLTSCSPTFTILPRGESRSNGLVKEATIVRYAKEAYPGDLALRTIFLEGEKADYSGMAGAVRSRYIPQDLEADEDSGLLIEVYGAMERTEQLLGVSYKKEVAYTDFSMAAALLDDLNRQGITRYDLRYMNWSGDGRDNRLSVQTAPAGSLGNENEYKWFQKAISENQVTLFPDYSLLYVRNDRLFDGFRRTADACRRLSGSYAKEFKQSIVSVGLDDSYKRYMLMPESVKRLLEDLSGNAEIAGWQGLSLSDIGSDLYSDFSGRYGTDRSQAQQIFASALEKASKNVPLLLEGGNLYTVAFASRLVGVPDTGSGYQITSREVPFVQMILSGRVAFYESAINMTENPQESFLRAIEHGSGLRYTLGCGDSKLLMNTLYRDLFSTQSEMWKETIVRQYQEYDAAMENLHGFEIVKHEQVGNQIFKSVYENGTVIYVNYGDCARVAGMDIPARGYLRVD